MSRPARLLVLIPFVCVATCGGPSSPGGPMAFELVEAEAFGGHNPTMKDRAFDLVFADFDLDGDPDLLINWHHLGPFELFENDGGVLRARDSGLAANAAAPGLFRSAFDAEKAAVEAGLYVWHEPDRRGAWQFLWFDPDGRFEGVGLELETSLRFASTTGLAGEEIETIDERRRSISLRPGTTRRRFGVTTDPIGVQLVVRTKESAGRRPPLFAGVPPVEQPGTVSLWKPDPHGMAWVDVEGSPHADLFVTRGALSGELLPPLPPKADSYWVRVDDGWVPRPLPEGYGRGRSVEWVDVDNDGNLEISVANEHTPNQLLSREGGKFVDRAPALGLDFEGGAVQCWGDADSDGFQDLFVLEQDTVRVFLNSAGRSFAAAIDLPLEAEGAIDPRNLFDRAALRLADFDSDGELDLWVLGRGESRGNTLFLRREEGWVEAGRASGLAGISGNNVSVLADFDNDGFEDLFTAGPGGGLWRNDRGQRLVEVESPWRLNPGLHAAAAADIDGDGDADIALAAWSRSILRNTSGGSSFRVELRDPRGSAVGAIVVAAYDDGRRVARRLGSERTGFSQTAEPLRFAAGARRVEVMWPGSTEFTVYPVADGDATLVYERPDQLR